MKNSRQTDRSTHTASQKSRLTIGYLAPAIHDASQTQWAGVLNAAQKHNLNLICFPGNSPHYPQGFDAQDNIIYDLVTSENVDGIVSWASSIGNYMSIEEIKTFHERHRPLPVVTIGRTLEGIPALLMDSFEGMREALVHLVEVHGYRRLAFIRGPEDHVYAQGRYQAYVETLEAYDIPFDPNLVTPPAHWGEATGIAAIRLLLDERGLRPQTDFEAIVAVSEDVLLGAVEVLQARKINIPSEVAVAGFDDTIRGQSSTPPLTSVAPPFYETGYLAVETLLTLMKSGQVPDETIVPSNLMIRQSCGCVLPAVSQVAVGPMEVRDESFEAALATRQTEILSAMMQEVGDSAKHMPDDWAERLLASFAAELEGQTPGIFLPQLDEMLREDIAGNRNLAIWQEGISALRRQVLPFLNGDTLWRAIDLWEQARVTIGETAQRQQAYQSLQAAQQAQTLRDIGAALITTFDLAGLMNRLAEKLPGLGIPSCYLALYENPQPYEYPQPAPEWSRLMLAYTDQERVELGARGQRFRSHELLPAELWPEGRQYSFVAEPLYFQNDELGFVLFEIGPPQGTIYEVLRGELSSALKGALLVQQEERRARQLQTVAEVSTATSTILDTAILLQKVVDLTKERFGLYHAHVYLLNETRETLNLVAGAGEPGRQMVAQGWSIPLGREQSLVARAARTGQVVVVDNVREAKDWLPNSLLPDTYAEMAVPIILEGKVVGVLDVQENTIGGLNQGDADLLRSLANHVAVTLNNAHLFEESTRSREEAEQAKEKAEQAQKEIEIANQTLEAQVWQTTGQAQLNDKMQGEQDIETLANNVIDQLCEYFQAQIGALYIVEDDNLKLVGSYAYSNKKGTGLFKLREGLVGQAAAKKQPLFLADIPNDSITIRSGFGEMVPRHIMVYPFIYENRVVGVIELGTLAEFSQTQMEFVQTALDSIAIAFNTAQARARIDELLAETQQQAEELQTQDEELRVANEELEAQTESLRASEAKLKEQQTELEATNTQLEEKAAALEESSAALQEKQATLDRQNQELKEAQQELQKQAEELARASQYKSEFLANMSHELRTPLNSLLILARMLADDKNGNLTDEQVESAQVIYSGGTDLLNLINDILDLSKVEAGQMIFNFEAMALSDLVSTMQLQFNHLAEEKGLAFNINLADDAPSALKTDPQRVKQIVKNLLSNAFKFTKQGSVSLNLYRPDSQLDLSRSGLEPSQAIAISVADTGIGMTADQLQVIFEAFQQADGSTSRQYGGTGLGLSISRELAAKLGGQIEVTSEPGQGSTFTLYLPLEAKTEGDKETTPELAQSSAPLQDKSQPKAKSSVSPAPVPASQPALPADDRAELAEPDDEIKIVAIIEDDPKFAKVVYDYAHQKGFKCLIENEGQSGLELVKAYQPQAIILDLNLPDMSGWEVLAALKNEPATRHIPVHIMSVDEEVLEAYRRGAMGYLTKPVSQEGLAEAFVKIEGLISREIKALLVVEDDENSRRSIKKLLGGGDVKISEAERGEEALELLQVQHFDCMILDLSLPDMSGFEVLNRMNENGAIERCPVIVYTGRELTPEEHEKLLRYADRVIVKGVKSPERLLDETALFLHRVVAEMPVDKQQTIKQLYSQDDLLKDKKILIVDDDMRNSFALSKLLSNKGVKVRIARDGQKALEMLVEDHNVDLILMDIMMPVMDGFETIKRIRAQQQFKALPILALTAKAMKGDREKCLAAGANDYLPKPVDVDRLFSMLRVWLYR